VQAAGVTGMVDVEDVVKLEAKAEVDATVKSVR